MASRRISKSAIDWAKFTQLIPKEEMSMFRQFKGHHDTMVASIAALPAELPQIDFNAYKERIPDKAFVDKIQAEYEKLAAKIPYPQNEQMKAQIKAQQAERVKQIEQFTVETKKELEKSRKELDLIESIPDPSRMTRQMQCDYFPESKVPEDEPKFFPYREIDQPGCPGIAEATIKRLPRKDQM